MRPGDLRRGGEAVARGVACTRLEKGRGSCVLGPGSALTPLGSKRVHRGRERGKGKELNESGSKRERGGINFLWREGLRWEGKLRCQGKRHSYWLARQFFFWFFSLSFFLFFDLMERKGKWERVDIIWRDILEFCSVCRFLIIEQMCKYIRFLFLYFVVRKERKESI